VPCRRWVDWMSSGGKTAGPFVSEHFDSLPEGAVIDFLDRHGIDQYKHGGDSWMNLQVVFSFECVLKAAFSLLSAFCLTMQKEHTTYVV